MLRTFKKVCISFWSNFKLGYAIKACASLNPTHFLLYIELLLQLKISGNLNLFSQKKKQAEVQNFEASLSKIKDLENNM